MLPILAKHLVKRLHLDTMGWRHHGLGMLQAEVDHELRVHIWHPDLVRIPEGPRRVHDHRFDIMSCIVVGSVTDVRYDVVIYDEKNDLVDVTFGGDPTRMIKTECWEIQHAKEQKKPGAGCSTATDATLIGQCWTAPRDGETSILRAPRTYLIPRREFHTTVTTELAVTLVHRSNFDDRLARVLGDASEGKSAIQPLDFEIIEKYVEMARDAIERLP
jgi:hypothetical protein